MALFLVFLPTFVLSQSLITLNGASQFGTWQGWGTSLAWMGVNYGDSDVLADLLFTTKDVPLRLGNVVPGLGLNIVRYNAGASSNVSAPDGSRMKTDGLDPRKQVPGYWLDWRQTDYHGFPAWDWSVDAKQRGMMFKAKDRGANIFQLFSNSPMWWMLYNHNPHGNGISECLQTWNYWQHAHYLASIAKVATDMWGIQFDSVEAWNEPASPWGDPALGPADQEGCHAAPATMNAVNKFLRQELNNYGLNSIKIASSDESWYCLAISTWWGFRGSFPDILQVHGYQDQQYRVLDVDALCLLNYGANGFALPKEKAQGLSDRSILYINVNYGSNPPPIWMSEYGDGDTTGGLLLSQLFLDFSQLHPVSWSYWQPVDFSGDWTLITTGIDYTYLRYYILAHFTRHIKQGMTIIGSGSEDVVAAYQPGLLVLVLRLSPGNWVIDLTKIQNSNFRSISHWVTNLSHLKTKGNVTDRSTWYQNVNGAGLYGSQIKLSVTDYSLHTIEVSETAPVDSWLSIYRCQDTTTGGPLFPWNQVKVLAKKASRIKITYPDGTFVVSKPNTYPIQRLRAGQTISFPFDSSYASPEVIQSAWEGSASRLAALWNSCGSPVDLRPNAAFYSACNNVNGLHIFQNGYCNWNFSGSVTPIDVQIDYDMPVNWKSIYSCQDNTNGNFLLPINQIKALAQTATRIKITHPDGTFVISKPNSYPIKRLRLGQTISFPFDTFYGYASPDVVRSAWEGPDYLLDVMWNSCVISNIDLTSPDATLYSSCNNGNGLHIGLLHDGHYCNWNFSGPVTPIDVQIDSAPSLLEDNRNLKLKRSRK